jgi:heptosyltransferase-2
MNSTNQFQKILVVGPSWVGDMVMAQSLFRALKRNNPDVCIDVLAGNWSQCLLARMPEINQHVSLPFKHGELALSKRRALGIKLREAQYEQAIVLPNSFKSALIPWWAKIPQRTGWFGECRFGVINDRRRLDKKKYPLMIERFVALSLPSKVPLPNSILFPRFKIQEENLAAALKKYQLNYAKAKVLALCPGAQYGESKRWPPSYYAELARIAKKQGWQIWLIGGPGETTLVQQIIKEALVPCVDLTMTTLAEAIDLFSVASCVVSNDSGLMHLAAAVDRPLVAIYGSSTPNFTPPLQKKSVVLQKPLDCQPCFKRACPLQHHRCMTAINPLEVWAAVEGAIEVVEVAHA